jgi:hypothetical protein
MKILELELPKKKMNFAKNHPPLKSGCFEAILVKNALRNLEINKSKSLQVECA